MAALTQGQWLAKISAWLPQWFFENSGYQTAVFQALAKVLSSADTEMRAQFDETFIMRALSLMLDQHGYERSILRNANETDENYAERIRQFSIALNPVSLELQAQTFLLTGTVILYEHEYECPAYDRDAFFDREEIYSDIYYDTFTLKIPYQGVGATGLAALEAVAAAMNPSKALGTLYRIVEFD